MDLKAHCARHRRAITKTLLIMKFTAIILLSACLTASAHGYGQKVTLSEKNVRLEKVFQILKLQTGYEFLYTDELVQRAGLISIELKAVELETALQILFKEQPLTFQIIEKTVVVKPRPEEMIDVDLPPPPIDVKGRVLNEKGEPVIATVTVKGSRRAVATNEKGEFTLSGISSEAVLVITGIGVVTLEVKVNGRTDIGSILVKTKVSELDKVVIQAYGTTSDRLRTGNISTVTAEEIERQPVMNPLLALQGKVAGMDVTQTTGFASGTVKAEIRGRTSINNVPSEPLYVIDGVPLTILELRSSSYINGSRGFAQSGTDNPAGGQSPLFSISPSDIESITVLKDADATAIYGSRGANGVVLITTKKGSSQRLKVEVNVFRGLSKITRNWEMMDTRQYISMRKEALANDGLISNTGNAYDILIWDTTKYTNWQNYLWGNAGELTESKISIYGGDALNSFRLSAGYREENAITAATGSDTKLTFLSNFSHKSYNQRFKIDFNNLYSFTQSDMVPLVGMSTYAPNSPSIYDSIGRFNFEEWALTGIFPFSSLLQPYVAKTYFLNSSLGVKFEILNGLYLSSNFGYSRVDQNTHKIAPIRSQDPSQFPTGSATRGVVSNNNLIVEPNLNYDLKIKQSKLSMLLGSSLQIISTNSSTEIGQGFLNDAFLGSIGNAPIKNVLDGNSEYKYAAIYGRVNYNLENKYLVNFSARRDGSSRFGPGKKFGNFWSVGAALILTEYNWFRNKLPQLSFAKVRGSYGITGSDKVGDYKYLTSWTAIGTLPYNGYPSYFPTQHSNADYRWEENKKLEVALKLGFFENKISIEGVWYRNRSDNQLVASPLPAMTGFLNVVANSPANVLNTGFEIVLGTKIIDKDRLKWNASFILSRNRNKLLSFPNLEQSVFSRDYIVGQPLNIRRVLKYNGVDAQTGYYTFEDRNGDGAINDNIDELDNDFFSIDINPKHFGSFGTDLSWKGFQFSMFFIFMKKLGRNAYSVLPGILGVNQPTIVLDRWQKPGDIARFAKFSTMVTDPSYNFYGVSDAMYTDASYLRLQNLSLTYFVPKSTKSKVWSHDLQVYFNAQNIFTISKYEGIDPVFETGIGGLPPSKVFTLGAKLTL